MLESWEPETAAARRFDKAGATKYSLVSHGPVICYWNTYYTHARGDSPVLPDSRAVVHRVLFGSAAVGPRAVHGSLLEGIL